MSQLPTPMDSRSLRRLFDGNPSSLHGMVFMVLATLTAASLHAIVRVVADSGLHPFQIAFFRNLFGLLVLLPWFLRLGLSLLHTHQRGLYLWRATTNTASMLLFFSALAVAPLPQVQALSFTGPLFATLLTVVVLGERLRARRLSALVIGFAGALVIIRPGVGSVDTGTWLVLAAAALWGVTITLIKFLSRTDSSVTITAYMALLMTPLSFIPALFVWRWPDAGQLLLLIAAGLCGGFTQLCLAQAFRVADATAVLPLDFLRLVWSALLAYWLFAEVSDLATWIGGGIIFVSATYIAFRERHLKVQTPSDLTKET